MSCNTKVFIPGDLAPLSSVPCSKCGHSIMMPLKLHGRELRAKIASGGMGTVDRAFDTVLEREVAVKLMKKEIEEDPNGLAAFYREARAQAMFNHTNIVQVYSYEEFEGQRFLVMELADRGTLDSRIEKYKRLPEYDVLDIGYKIAYALDTVLNHDLLHCDIKPANILFNAENEPKLVDFGLARKVDSEPDDDLRGTPYYVAPEKVKREKETFLSDMYSLGGTLYHALTGHTPFEAPTIEELVGAHVHTALMPPIEVVPEITQATSDLLVKTLAKNPGDRFLSYIELRLAFEAARAQLLLLQSQAPEDDKPKGKTSWWRR